MSLRTPTQVERTPSVSTETPVSTPDTQYVPEEEEEEQEEFLRELVDTLATPLWLIARGIARLANVPMSELEQEDADGSEFSVETTEADGQPPE